MESPAGIKDSLKTTLTPNWKKPKEKEKKCKICLITVLPTPRNGSGIGCKICKKCQLAKAKKAKELKAQRKLQKKLKKQNSPKKLKEKLDSLVSEYVRRRAANAFGEAMCVTCSVSKPWKEMQCGHYVSRSHFSTRYDLRNCHVQCVKDNIFLKGNYPKYTAYLLSTYGKEWLETLIKDGDAIRQWTVPELLSEIEKFKILLNQL